MGFVGLQVLKKETFERYVGLCKLKKINFKGLCGLRVSK